MITSEVIIGKIVEFIVGKSLSAVGKLSMSNRRKACRSLTKLYYSLQALEDVTESIFRTVSDFRGTETGEAFAVMNALSNHMHELALASNMFVDLDMNFTQDLRSLILRSPHVVMRFTLVSSVSLVRCLIRLYGIEA